MCQNSVLLSQQKSLATLNDTQIFMFFLNFSISVELTALMSEFNENIPLWEVLVVV